MNTKSEKKHPIHAKLNQYLATAICGNDILSSTLYVSGIAAIFAGVYAPIVLLMIVLVLFLYKAVYTEVVEALPINGGAYNCLLNGTSKIFASVAGVMTILSYIATAVISAKVGIEYLHTILPIPVIPVTIGLLFAFAVLVVSGIQDSAKVALGIFVTHIITLIVVVIAGLIYFLKGNSLFMENFRNTGGIIATHGNLTFTLFLAFSASLLGVSGFESSANFVEEQEKGVFRKTLRNMLIGVAIFNPLISLVTLNSLPLSAIGAAKDFLLADTAKVIGGSPLLYLVVIDACMVLAGAVLTSFVGVSGLAYRMSSDACLPEFLGKKNNKGSYPIIIFGFFVLCSSILLMTGGELLSLAGVYTISFLGVMTSFAFGNLILRETRTELKRTYRAPLLFVAFAFISTFIGIVGNILIDQNNVKFFAIYFIPSLIVVGVIIYQDYILKSLLRLTKNIPVVHNFLMQKFSDLVEGRFIVFVHHTNRLHSILDYINRNETGWNITLIHCKSEEKGKDTGIEEFQHLIPDLQKAGVFPHFNINVEYVDEEFTPKLVDKISKSHKVHKNRMFIGSIHHFHEFDYSELGGVRIIF